MHYIVKNEHNNMHQQLKCTHNVNDIVAGNEICGRLTFARIFGSYHWFIMVESGKYKRTRFIPSKEKRVVAFSYVPDATLRYINEKYMGRAELVFFKSPGDELLSTLVGYLPFLFTQSRVLDTWKLTDKYITIASKPVHSWRFQRFPQFRVYNICSLVPFLGITDCIGYSTHHYNQSCNGCGDSV
jgi:hypothetical protein